MLLSNAPDFVVQRWTFSATLSALALALAGCSDDTNQPAAAPDAAASLVETDDTERRPPRPRPSTNNPPSNPPVQNLPPAVPVDGPETEQCGNVTCRDRLVGDIVVEPCCVNGDTCGLNLSSVSGFMPVADGCVAVEQPGANDATCPSVYFEDIVNPRELVGCCRPDGVCGVVADLSDTLANFGCVDPREFLTGRGEQSPVFGDRDEEPGIHLTDGGGFYVTDGGASSSPLGSGACVPREPEPTPEDAGDAATDAAPSPPATEDARDAAPNTSAPDASRSTPPESTTTPTPDAAASDAG